MHAGITDTGNVTVAGNLVATTDANSGVIDMGTLRVDGTMALTTDGDGDATVVNDTLLDFANSTVRGDLVATATTGNIIDTGVLTISGTSTFTTSQSNDDITLGSVNVLTGAVTLNTSGSTGHAVVDNGTTALIIAASSVGGDLTLTSGAAAGITDSGTVTVGGNLAATTDDNSGVINMGTIVVTGAVALTTDGTGDATVSETGRLTLGTSTVGGNLDATSTTGNIQSSSVLTIAGTSAFTTSTGNKIILLNNTSNAFTGALTITTNDASGADAYATIDGGTTALIIATSTIDGNLTLTSGHASGITDTGNVTVAGNLIATTDANSGVIDMGTLEVDGTMALTTDGDGDATIVNDDDINFATSTVAWRSSLQRQPPVI